MPKRQPKVQPDQSRSNPIAIPQSDPDQISTHKTVAFSPEERIWSEYDGSTNPLFHHERYEDLGLLGIGSTGMVRRVFDRRLNRKAAMKILHLEHVANSNIVKRFISEAQGTSQLQHPGTVAIYDLDQFPDGRWFFTMQEVQGETLQKGYLSFFKQTRSREK